jgi:dTDP-4-dehydrorhamnose reductase
MKVLVLGIDGMIGHKIAQSIQNNYELIGTSRKDIKNQDIGLNQGKIVKYDFLKHNLESLLKNVSPSVIINCVGITPRRGINESIKNFELLNSKLPHFIDNWTKLNKSKLIHFSTDCVYSGDKGNYYEDSDTDAKDTYGITKAKGEINNNHSLTLRSSMIGRELFNFTELFEWLYSMREKSVEGYSQVIYSGITTVRMGKIINKILKNNLSLSGIFNISSTPISKHELLQKLSNAFDLNVDINENKNIKSNKVLNSKKFTEITGINPPHWDELIEEFKLDCEKFKSLYKN